MSVPKQSVTPTLSFVRQHRVSILGAVLVLGFAYIAVPQLGFFNTSWKTLLGSDWRLFMVAIGCLLLSFAAATVIYQLLAAKSLRFGSTFIIQIAGAFAGKVLPVGLGSISINYLYLRRRGHGQAVAATIVAVNNLLGFVGHGIWLLVLALLLSSQLSVLTTGRLSNGWLVPGLGAGLLVIVALVVVFRKRLTTIVRDVLSQLHRYRKRPGRLLGALVASMVLTACNIAIVWLSGHALHISLTLVVAAVALTTGVLAQSATPTPGGLGGVEAGLVAGLTLGGLSLEHAVAVTILFRFVTFWVPLGLGGVALLLAVRQKLL